MDVENEKYLAFAGEVQHISDREIDNPFHACFVSSLPLFAGEEKEGKRSGGREERREENCGGGRRGRKEKKRKRRDRGEENRGKEKRRRKRRRRREPEIATPPGRARGPRR